MDAWVRPYENLIPPALLSAMKNLCQMNKRTSFRRQNMWGTSVKWNKSIFIDTLTKD